jgi:glycosyltransferase involved in cell wall biosynthesis
MATRAPDGGALLGAAQGVPADPLSTIAQGEEPLVSALINNCNYADFVGEAIESCLAQTYPKVEVIVVDDGSTDGSREVLQRYADRIRAIFQPNGGQGAAVNTGIREARGEVLCLLDADDTWFPEKVASVVEKYRQGPWGLVSHDLLMRGDRGVRVPEATWSACTGVRLREGRVFADLVRERLVWAFSPTSGLSLPAALARRIGPLPERDWRNAVDTPIAYAAAYLGPVGAISTPLGHYRVHGRNDLGFERFGPERKRVWRLWHLPRREKFLREFLARRGDRLEIELCRDYLHLRDWCLIASRVPVAHLPALWRESVRFRRSAGRRWPGVVASLLKDAAAAGVATLPVPSRFRRLRRLYREEILGRNG